VGLLERILHAKRAELAGLGRLSLPAPPERRAIQLRRGAGQPLALIAEIKRRSPSAGALSKKLSVGERAAAYERAGASMVSVLCDRAFFDGSLAHLQEARQACGLPILCKDFILDERQLDLARAYGADAALLIVRCLSAERCAELLQAARERGLEALVEVTNEREMQIALEAAATFVGVNARDLDTLELDVEKAARVLASLPASVTAVQLSGLKSPDAVAGVAAGRADAALIGEALMREDDPEPLLRSMVERARG